MFQTTRGFAVKKLFLVALIAMLTACGGTQHRTSGIEESTMLIIRGETLVGLTVSIEPGITRVIQEQDLTPYSMGVLGAKDKEEESLETVTFKVETGQLNVKVSRGGAVIVSRQMQFSHGQTRELRITK
jgi:hypothetical protein